MRQIDNMTPREIDTLALKGMTSPRTASEKNEIAREQARIAGNIAIEQGNKAQHSPERAPYSATKAQASYEEMKADKSKSWSQIRCEELQSWYEQACADREAIKAHADKLAEQVRKFIAQLEDVPYWTGESRTEALAVLAAYEKDSQ